jgi:hypothetical protein
MSAVAVTGTPTPNRRRRQDKASDEAMRRIIARRCCGWWQWRRRPVQRNDGGDITPAIGSPGAHAVSPVVAGRGHPDGAVISHAALLQACR